MTDPSLQLWEMAWGESGRGSHDVGEVSANPRLSAQILVSPFRRHRARPGGFRQLFWEHAPERTAQTSHGSLLLAGRYAAGLPSAFVLAGGAARTKGRVRPNADGSGRGSEGGKHPTLSMISRCGTPRRLAQRRKKVSRFRQPPADESSRRRGTNSIPARPPTRCAARRYG